MVENNLICVTKEKVIWTKYGILITGDYILKIYSLNWIELISNWPDFRFVIDGSLATNVKYKPHVPVKHLSCMIRKVIWKLTDMDLML